MERIRIAVIGVGNCANSLIQGIYYYRDKAPEDAVGLMHWDVGGYTPGDIEVVAAFDVDARKVGCDLSEAIFAPPNCTKVFKEDIPVTGVKVAMGRVMDGVADHMKDYPEDETFVVSDGPEADVVSVLEENGAEIVLNYLPVGSEDATRYYAG